MELLKASLNNNLLIVHHHMVTKPVTVVLWTMLSNSSRITELFTKMNIHTKLLNKPAPRLEEPSRFADSCMIRAGGVYSEAKKLFDVGYFEYYWGIVLYNRYVDAQKAAMDKAMQKH